jgi:hypothetical protein
VPSPPPKGRTSFTSRAQDDRVLRLDGTLEVGDGYCYLHEYQPYRILGERNPKFDADSRRILDLKDGEDGAIQHYHKLLLPLIHRGVALVALPSHDPQKATSGIRKLVAGLAETGHFEDHHRSLLRIQKIAKLAAGGERGFQIQFDSMRVKLPKDVPQRILILDDVVTTGSSLKAARQHCLDAGATRVHCLALARTV